MAESKERKMRVAIVGAGICGASTAYYLSKKEKSAEIVVFERSAEVGGRTRSVPYKGHRFNVGAGFFINDNRNVVELMKEFGVASHLSNKDKQSRICWDGDRVHYDSTTWRGFFWLLWNFGPTLFRLKRFLAARLKQFVAIYPKIDLNNGSDFVCETPADFLREVGSLQEVNDSGLEFCRKIGLSPAFVETFLYGFVKGIYINNIAHINGFAMMVTMQGMFQKAYTADGGSDHVVRQMLVHKNDFCSLRLSASVTEIEKVGAQGKYRIQYQGKEKTTKEELFDVVVLATPFQESNISLKNIKLPPQMQVTRQAKRVEVELWEGRVNNEFFGLSASHRLLESLIIMQKAESKLGPINSFDQSQDLGDGDLIYRTESDTKVPEDLLKKMFLKYKRIEDQQWPFAYPLLKPIQPESLPPFVIEKGLYFPSALEFASSCMEIQTIAAKNTVKLILREKEGK